MIRSDNNKLLKLNSFDELEYLKNEKEKQHSDYDELWKVGQIKFFDPQKGFGFVSDWDDNREHFIHISKIITLPIEESDYVVFKLRPSKKKPGTFEAFSLCQVSKFKKSPNFLFEQYSKYRNEYFRGEILKSFSVKNILKLISKELAGFTTENENIKYSEFRKRINPFLVYGEKKDSLEKILDLVLQFANPESRFRLWLEGIIQSSPSEGEQEEYFLKSSENDRLEIFKRTSQQSQKKLVLKLLDENDPVEVLDFIFNHLRRANNLSSYEDLKSKLYTSEYWEDKQDYNLFLDAIERLKKIMNPKQEMALFFEKYLKSFSKEPVISGKIVLTQEEIEKVLESQVFSKTETFNLFQNRLVYELDLFETENSVESNQYMNEDNLVGVNQERVKSVCWLLELAEKYLSEKELLDIETAFVNQTSEKLHFHVWEEGSIKNIPEKAIYKVLTDSKNIIKVIDQWITNQLISNADLIGLLKTSIHGLGIISNRKQFYILSNHLKALAKYGGTIDNDKQVSIKNNLWFVKLAYWIEGRSEEFSFDEYKSKLVFLLPDDQIKFLRKLFSLAHSGKFDLTVDKLNQLIRVDYNILQLSDEFQNEIPIDISVDVTIEAISAFSKHGKFLIDSELLKVVLKNVTLNKEHKFKIEGLFEKCEGRYKAEYNWNSNGQISKIPFGSDQFYWSIEFSPGEYVRSYSRGPDRFIPNENFEELKEKVKQLPGRKWNTEEQHWGVPAIHEEKVMAFARENRFFIDIEGSNYANNTHLADFKRTEVPNGIQFCEGRLAKEKDFLFNKNFWWCCNQPCFDNCETIHQPDEWRDYTLLDFLTILGYNLNDINSVDDQVEKGKYYQFVATINRFNRLLERMYCEECKQILFPIEDSHFAHYRVVRFHCENSSCKEYHQEIYLHHCLNGKCKSIIDSRKSKKCPNGLYICSNENCGCCCSDDMMKRRYENLSSTGGVIPQKLKMAVDQKIGHLDRGEHFCYKCGKLMNELSKDVYQCDTCEIQYDVTTRPRIQTI